MFTTITLKHRRYRDATPYICHGIPGQKDAACETFMAAVEYARQMGCRGVKVVKSEVPRDAALQASRAGIEIEWLDA